MKEKIKKIIEILFKNKKIIYYALIALIVTISYKLSFPSVSYVFKESDKASKKHPIYAVQTNEKKVSISFDASWGSEKTSKILDILDEYNVKTTFFICGYWIDKYPEKVKEIYSRGHEIGNHSETHKNQSTLSMEKNKQELQSVHEKIRHLIGVDMNLFRPPYGDYNNTVLKAADDLGYYTIKWSVDSHDWMNKGVDYELNQVLKNKNLKEGAILLFHNDAEDTLKALPTLLKSIQSKGYEIVPISKLIYLDNYVIDQYGIQQPNK